MKYFSPSAHRRKEMLLDYDDEKGRAHPKGNGLEECALFCYLSISIFAHGRHQ